MTTRAFRNLSEQVQGLSTDWREAIKLVSHSIKDLGYKYSVFVFCILSLALTSLLPPKLFHFFSTEAAKDLDPMPQVIEDLLLFGALIGCALFLSTFCSILLKEWLRLSIEGNLRKRVLRRLHGMPLEALDEAERGEWLTRMTGDLGNVENFMTESIPEQLRDFVILIGASALFIGALGGVAWLAVGAALILALFNFWVQRRLSPILAELRSLNGRVFHALIENFEGKKTIKSQMAEEAAFRAFSQKISRIIRKGMGVVRVLGALIGSNQLGSQMLITISLTGATWFLAKGQINFSEALVIPFYIGMFFNSAQNLAGAGYTWNRFFIEGGRLAHLLLNEKFDGSPNELDTENQLHLEKVDEIALENLKVGFAEGIGEKVICGPQSLSFKRFQTAVLWGASGCGKSSTLEVLAGLRSPLAGKLKVTDESLVVLWQESGKGVRLPRNLCAYVEQRPYLFQGTIRDNLLFGPSIDRQGPDLEDQIKGALKRVDLWNFVDSLGGTSAPIQDRGENLSEGQRYRLGMARALLLSRPFLLLDEPFAALDDLSVTKIVKTLNQEAKTRGLVIVTHYLPTGLSLDRVYRFDQDHSSFRPMTSETGTRRGFVSFPPPANTPMRN